MFVSQRPFDFWTISSIADVAEATTTCKNTQHNEEEKIMKMKLLLPTSLYKLNKMKMNGGKCVLKHNVFSCVCEWFSVFMKHPKHTVTNVCVFIFELNIF